MRIRINWSRGVFSAVLAGVAVGTICWWRADPLAPAVAAPPPPASAPAPAPAPLPPEVLNAPAPDSARWVVAYIHGSVAITREMLGEYLIARLGEARMQDLLHLKIIEHECQQQGITVSAAEVENGLREELQRLRLTRKEFENRVLKLRQKTLHEYKEDVIRPHLLMSRLCAGRVQIAPEDIRRAYESHYGEKVDCQIIFWSKDKAKEAREAYARIRKDAAAFDHEARAQEFSNLAATAGKIEPIGRHANDNPTVEEAAFRLKPGEVSELIEGKEGGFLVVKCLGRIPGQNREMKEVVAALEQEVREKKLQQAIQNFFPDLKKRANPENRLVQSERPAQRAPEVQLVSAQFPAAGRPGTDPLRPSPDYSQRVVGYIYGNVPITREMLGEFLIARVGVQRLDSLINKLIIEYACSSKGIDVTPVEVEAALQQTLLDQKLTLDQFKERLATEHRSNLYEWREDVIRPRLLLTKLLHGQVQAQEEEIRKAYEAHHGEKVELQIILWPREEAKRVTMMYSTLRDKPDEFDKAASTQASPNLARLRGRIQPIGRYSTGNDEMEKIAFALRPGEVSHMMGVPEGLLVMKCLGRVPPSGKPLEQVRAELEREVIEKKTVLEIPRLAAELQKAAKPVKILKDQEDPIQIKREVEAEIETLERKDGKSR